MINYLNIQSVADLQIALTHQRIITRQTLLELDIAAERLLPQHIPEGEELAIVEGLREQEVSLLETFSRRPTLIELDQNPALRGLFRDHATFSVAAIVGEVLLSQIQAQEPGLARFHRIALTALMQELGAPDFHEAELSDTITRMIALQASSCLLKEEEERKRPTCRMVEPLVSVMLLVLLEYRLADRRAEEGYLLTGLGERVLLHLFAAQRFIDAVGAAHGRLKNERRPA